jgi:hypothetical protein
MNRRLFLFSAGAGVAAAPACHANDKPATTYRATDVELIATWLLGRDTGKAFDGKFGDSKWLTDAKDAIAYTDVAGVNWPKGLRSVPYDFIRARLSKIHHGGKASPGIVIAGSVPAEPPEENVQVEKLVPAAGERYYYVELGIGNAAWHSYKIAIRDVDGKPQANVLRSTIS